tara:strand:+ start:41 stop:640 length:600 start_codon:yes stop_codon:yes gene_type:complete
MAAKGRKERMIDAEEKIIRQIEALGPQDKYTPKATQDKYDYLIGQLRKGMPEMKMGGKVQKMKDGGLTILDKTMKPKSEDARGKLSQKDKDDYKEMKDYLKPSVQKQLGNAFKNLTTKSKKNDTQRAIARGQAKQIIRTVGKMDGGVKAQRIAKKGGNPDIQKKMGFVGETRGPKKFKYGGAVNTTRSVQINPFTGEPI